MSSWESWWGEGALKVFIGFLCMGGGVIFEVRCVVVVWRVGCGGGCRVSLVGVSCFDFAVVEETVR